MGDWFGGGSAISESWYAVRAWAMIQRRPSSITIKRGATTLAAQTVRVEFSVSEREVTGADGAMSVVRDTIVFGVRNHPSATNTDIQRGDVFVHNGNMLRVIDVIVVSGGVQAHCEVMS